MKESDLYAPVARWLTDRGLTVWAEVPYYESSIDVVGANLDTGYTVVVELKRTLCKKVVSQAMINGQWAHEEWAAVGVRPKDATIGRLIDRSVKCLEDVGLLLVDGENCVPLLQANKDKRVFNDFSRQRMLEKLREMEPGGVGGVPCMAGVGPAQDVLRQVEAYREQRPRATWAEMFENIPNHYANARSMQGAIRNIEKWNAIKAARRAAKAERKAGAA